MAREATSPRAMERVLRCLYPETSPTSFDAVANWTPDVWNQVVNTATGCSLGPLLFRRLKDGDKQAYVPTEAWEQLRFAYFAAADTNARLRRLLADVLRRLTASGVRTIVLKGALLAETVYHDWALRPMQDVDIMVPRESLADAEALLFGMGGVRCDVSTPVAHKHLPPLAIDGYVFEIHWTPFAPSEPFEADPAGLWQRARPTTVAGVEALVLSPEDLLLHLCLHAGFAEQLARPRSLCDVAETTRHYGESLDWSQFVSLAYARRATRYAGLALQLAQSVLGAGVPDGVIEQLLPGGLDQRLADTARECLLGLTGYGPWTSVFTHSDPKSFIRRVGLLRERIFLPRDQMARKYPASQTSRSLYLYYLLRVRDVVRTFAVRTLKRNLPIARSRQNGDGVALVNWLTSGKPQ